VYQLHVYLSFQEESKTMTNEFLILTKCHFQTVTKVLFNLKPNIFKDETKERILLNLNS